MEQHIMTIDEVPSHTFGVEDYNDEHNVPRKFLIELLREKSNENY